MDTLKLHQPAPDFSLPDLAGTVHHLEDYRGQVVVVNFTSAECPWSARADQGLLGMLGQYGEQIILLPVASNANETPEQIAEAALQRELPRVLLDREQIAARRYQAKTTPHLFIIDADGRLRYQGAYDDVTFRRREPTQAYARQAVQALLAGHDPDPAETRPYGCTIVLEI
jgi:peroxiredoxin